MVCFLVASLGLRLSPITGPDAERNLTDDVTSTGNRRHSQTKEN